MLSPHRRCRTFGADADNTTRGCAVVVLKRLDDATADGDRVLGVIRFAVNQDSNAEPRQSTGSTSGYRRGTGSGRRNVEHSARLMGQALALAIRSRSKPRAFSALTGAPKTFVSLFCKSQYRSPGSGCWHRRVGGVFLYATKRYRRSPHSARLILRRFTVLRFAYRRRCTHGLPPAWRAAVSSFGFADQRARRRYRGYYPARHRVPPAPATQQCRHVTHFGAPSQVPASFGAGQPIASRPVDSIEIAALCRAAATKREHHRYRPAVVADQNQLAARLRSVYRAGAANETGERRDMRLLVYRPGPAISQGASFTTPSRCFAPSSMSVMLSSRWPKRPLLPRLATMCSC